MLWGHEADCNLSKILLTSVVIQQQELLDMLSDKLLGMKLLTFCCMISFPSIERMTSVQKNLKSDLGKGDILMELFFFTGVCNRLHYTFFSS